MISDIDEAYFNFDRVELEKLKRMSHKEVTTELRKLAKTFTVIDDISKKKSFTFPNIIMACDASSKNSDSTYGYCSNNKFIITQANLNKMIDILAYDIINPAKWKWLFNSMFIDRTIDFFKFIRRANETITVEFVE
jgi:hypothetical protein